MEATILYKTDHHHSYASRDLIGVYTNKNKLKQAVRSLVKEDQEDNPGSFETKEAFNDYIRWNIEFFFEKGQTQGLSEFELSSEQIALNKIV